MQTAKQETEQWVDDAHAQYLTFKVGKEMFAVSIQSVKEIIEYGGVTTVPMMPEFVRGVINLRGSVVPVIDLACRFGREPAEISRRSCIVVVEVRRDDQCQELGMLVDSVSAVVEIPADDIEPAPAFGTRVRAEFISGMGKIEGQFVILLNMNRVLEVEEMAQLAKSSQLVEPDEEP